MSNRLFQVAALAAMLTTAAVVQSAPLTHDSNQGIADSAKITDSDPRLAQKVTYPGGYKRLHDIAEDLSQLTGVTIRAGSSTRDWQVRDIPLTVYIKDLPLEEVLHRITETAHCSLTTGTEHDQPVYRIARTAKGRRDISDLIEKQKQADIADLNWQWDALVQLSSMPYDKLKQAMGTPAADRWRARGRLLSRMTPEQRSSIFSGELLHLSNKDRKLDADLRDVYGTLGDTAPQGDMAASAVDKIDCFARASVGLDVSEPSLTMSLQVQKLDEERSQALFLAGRIGDREWLEKARSLELLPRPQRSYAGLNAQVPADAILVGPENTQTAALEQKVKIPPPRNKRTVFSDAVAALASASGWSIISEDFVSQKNAPAVCQTYSAFFGSETNLQKALGKLGGVKWFVDDKSTLMIGRSRSWVYDHTNLVPAALIADLLKKAPNGLELEDLLPVAGLRLTQFGEWFGSTLEMGGLAGVYTPETNEIWTNGIQSNCSHFFENAESLALWRLYAACDPEAKRQALTGKGLPLSVCDPALVRQVLAGARRDVHGVSLNPATGFTGNPASLDLGSDLQNLSLRMRTVVTPYPADAGEQPKSDRHAYQIEMLSHEGNEVKVRRTAVSGSFPLFPLKTQERLAGPTAGIVPAIAL